MSILKVHSHLVLRTLVLSPITPTITKGVSIRRVISLDFE
jgi:hypothetical protein